MNFKLDLENIIKCRLDAAGIEYESDTSINNLASWYYDLLVRRIEPVPREVHFSEELNYTLGELSSGKPTSEKLASKELAKKTDTELEEEARKAWGATFRLSVLLETGCNVLGFLTKDIDYLHLTKKDRLLWGLSIHHFHLGREPDKNREEFIERSDYILFAVITETDAYFVDIRAHPKELEDWIQPDLLEIVWSNWPALIEAHALRGVKETVLTDEEKRILRMKNSNYATQFGDHAVVSIKGGTTADGSSLWGRIMGMRLLRAVEDNQRYFESQPAESELRSRFEAEGIEVAGGTEFQLVSLESSNPPPELIDALKDDQCLGKDLCHMGFAIVEATTQTAIVVSTENLADS